MKYKVTLNTVASITVTVEADDEDGAFDEALERAREFSGSAHQGHDWIAGLNDEWQYGEPEIEQV